MCVLVDAWLCAHELAHRTSLSASVCSRELKGSRVSRVLAHICVRMRVRMCVCACAYAYAYACVCVCAHACAHVCVCVRARVHACLCSRALKEFAIPRENLSRVKG